MALDRRRRRPENNDESPHLADRWFAACACRAWFLGFFFLGSSYTPPNGTGPWKVPRVSTCSRYSSVL